MSSGCDVYVILLSPSLVHSNEACAESAAGIVTRSRESSFRSRLPLSRATQNPSMTSGGIWPAGMRSLNSVAPCAAISSTKNDFRVSATLSDSDSGDRLAEHRVWMAKLYSSDGKRSVCRPGARSDSGTTGASVPIDKESSASTDEDAAAASSRAAGRNAVRVAEVIF